MKRPDCPCFASGDDSHGDRTTDTVGRSISAAFDHLKDKTGLCPAAGIFAAGACVTGLAISVTVDNLHEENPRATDAEILALLPERSRIVLAEIMRAAQERMDHYTPVGRSH